MIPLSTVPPKNALLEAYVSVLKDLFPEANWDECLEASLNVTTIGPPPIYAQKDYATTLVRNTSLMLEPSDTDGEVANGTDVEGSFTRASHCGSRSSTRCRLPDGTNES